MRRIDTRETDAASDRQPVVEYCVNNPSSETRQVLRDGPVDDRGLACLERCGTCRSTPFLVADGIILTGPTHDAILAVIMGEEP